MIDPIRYRLERGRALLPGYSDPEIVDMMIEKSIVRIEMCREDPLLFAITYLGKHLRSEATGDQVTLSEFHLDMVRLAKTWMRPTEIPLENRHAVIAPRDVGKSTWSFLILPLWAAAYGYVKFAAAFADSSTQAETHLATFKRELDTNARLRQDFPDLVAPARRPRGVQVSDNRGMLYTKSGFVFSADGIDSSTLGKKVENLRPDLLILDDIEKGESNYSAYQAKQRLSTVQNVVLPMNLYAKVMVTGTTTMSGSIVHQLVQAGRGEDPAQWILDEQIQIHYWPAILHNEDGSERSIWPAKWSMEFLNSIRHTRAFAMNFQNLPVPADSAYWTQEDFAYGRLPAVTRVVLSVDPAVTTKKKSDQTALAVVGFDPSAQRFEVREVKGVRLRGAELRQRVLSVLSEHPEIRRVIVEVNQGGETWLDVLHDLPVKIVLVSQSEPKEVRAARLLNHYQRGRVLHTQPLYDLEQQMIEFPNGLHDDLIDATGTAVDHLLATTASRVSVRSRPYV